MRGCVYEAEESGVVRVKAKVLNINFGHNATLMEKCKRLMHYSIFIDTVNKHISKKQPLDIAINLAIDECIENGILVDILEQNRGEVSHMLLTEFDQKKHDKNMWQDGHDEGYDEGYDCGERVGFDKAYRDSIIRMINNGKTPEEIADFCGYDINRIKEIVQSMNQGN